jgi:DNA-binding transcriptional regulator YiaG
VKKKQTKRSKNYEAMLIESIRQGLEIDQGERAPAHQYVLTARNTTVKAPPTYDAAAIRRLRERLRVSQEVFAQMMNVSLGAVRSWEQGDRTPSGAIQRLLHIFDRHTDSLLDELHAGRGHAGSRRLLGSGEHRAVAETGARTGR